MTLEQLIYLVEIAKYHSMSTAAKELHMTQQNISHAVKKLETELDLMLFERTPQGVRPTQNGRMIIDSAQRILNEINDIKEYASRSNARLSEADEEQIKGDIHLLLAPYFAREPLMNMVNRFLKDHPLVNLDLYVNSTMSILESSKNDKRFIALVNMTANQLAVIQKSETPLHCEVISSDQLVILANAHSKIGQQKSVSISKLLKQRLLFYNDSRVQDDWLLECFRTYGEPQTVIRTNNIEMGVTSLKNDVAILPMAKAATSHFATDEYIAMIPVRPRVDVFNVFLKPHDHEMQAAERLLLQQIRSSI